MVAAPAVAPAVAPSAAAALAPAPASVAGAGAAVAISPPRVLRYAVLPASLQIDGFGMGAVTLAFVRSLLGEAHGPVDAIDSQIARAQRMHGPTNLLRINIVQRPPVPRRQLAAGDRKQPQQFAPLLRWDHEHNQKVVLFQLGLLMHCVDADVMAVRTSLRNSFITREFAHKADFVIDPNQLARLSAGFCMFALCLFRNMYDPRRSRCAFPPAPSVQALRCCHTILSAAVLRFRLLQRKRTRDGAKSFTEESSVASSLGHRSSPQVPSFAAHRSFDACRSGSDACAAARTS